MWVILRRGHEPAPRPHSVHYPRPRRHLFVWPHGRVGDVRPLVQPRPGEDDRARTDRFLVARDVEPEIGACTPGLDEFAGRRTRTDGTAALQKIEGLSLIHISEPTRLRRISYAVF